MSLDASLKAANALVRHRNVLTRDERLTKLKEDEKWQQGKSVFGLPKVAHRKLNLAKAAKEEAPAEGAAVAAGAAGAAAPAAGAGAAPAKGAAPAAAKGAAPAKGVASAKGAAPAAAAPAAKGKK
jgi:small basic protein (TIGR04137 family)